MESKDVVISIIIPVYNGEKYLPECIASVCACDDEAIECILVNDGSTDATRAICEAAISGDKRFSLINRENGGIAEARNTGISAATGEYIFFLDADDYIDIAQWGEILSYARDSNADLIAFGYYSLFESGNKQEERFRIKYDSSGEIADALHALLASPMLNVCWGKLLRRAVIEKYGLRFNTSLVTCEDAVFMIDFADKARTFLLCNIFVLHYRIHEQSAMHKRTLEDKMEDFRVLYDRRVEFLKARPDPELRRAAYRECFSVLTDMVLLYAAKHNTRELRDACRFMFAHPVTQEILGNTEPHTVIPFYKRLEYALMRRGCILPLSFYFNIKSRFK